jgi:signal transduction histidine kinase
VIHPANICPSGFMNVKDSSSHNTVKHAEASRVDLRLRLMDGMVVLEVRDDGKGFEATGSFPGHLGLHSMRECLESLDGGLHIESAPGQGTSIRAHIPTRKTTKLTVGE